MKIKINIYVIIILTVSFGYVVGYYSHQPECNFDASKAVLEIENLIKHPENIPYSHIIGLEFIKRINDTYFAYKPPSEYLLRLMVNNICTN